MRINELSPQKGSNKNRRRVGRGVGSGHGKTAGRGTKGQNSRSGGGVRPGYEGGQMPMHRRVPKRGFRNIFKKKIVIINISDLSRFEANSVIDEIALVKAGLIKGKRDGIKLLGNGDLGYSLTVKVNEVSESAKKKIEDAGGAVEVV